MKIGRKKLTMSKRNELDGKEKRKEEKANK
jgi:hypothetical protein